MTFLLDYKRLISKIAADKNNQKLGKIIRVDRLPGKTDKKYESFVIILLKRFLRKGITVPVEASKVIKIVGTYVWFDITLEEFNVEVERLKKIHIERDIYPGDTGVYQGKMSGHSFDPYNLGHKRKERRR